MRMEDWSGMSKEQLQRRIRDEVQKAILTSPGLLRNYRLLQSLLEKKQRQGTRFLDLCQSVMEFEDTVKELYSKLGWEYTPLDSDSDSNDGASSCRRTLPFIFVSTGNQIHRPSTSRVSTHQSSTSEDEEITSPPVSTKEAVVILRKLTSSQIAAALPLPFSVVDGTSDEGLSSAESDMQWEPDEEISESEGSVSDFSTGSNKKRKINKSGRKQAKLICAPKRSRRSATTSVSTAKRRRFGVMETSRETSAEESTVKTTSRAKRTQNTPSNTADSPVTQSATPPPNTVSSPVESASRVKTTTTKALSNTTSSHITQSATPPPNTVSSSVKTSTGKTANTTAASNTPDTSTKPDITPSARPKPSTVSSSVKTSTGKTANTTAASNTPDISTKPDIMPSARPKPSTVGSSVKTMSTGKTANTTAPSNTPNTTSEAPITQTTTVPSNTGDTKSKVTVAPTSQQPSKMTSDPPSVPKEEIKLNMNVLARRKCMCWQRGKVAEIITKENGKVKYKVTFEGKGKVLVSGHHLAIERMPRVEELSVGCRVVVKSPSDEAEYQPAIMAELPGRKNRMRFLVYTDDHTPIYVGLPSFRVVYSPLENPLDDIQDENHREFIREYLRVWPYPPLTQYKVGQSLKAEHEGVMQKCEVVTTDSSLIEVVFESDKHKEWLYRGSLRLEHMVNMKYCIWKKQEDKSTKKP